MKEFFLILFFGSKILLTPQPVSIQSEMAIRSDVLLNAITDGAHLEIDISANVPKSDGLMARFNVTEKLYPAGAVKAKLFNGDREVIELEYKGGMTSAPALLLVSDRITTDLAFNNIVIYSKVQIENARVTWVNYSK